MKRILVWILALFPALELFAQVQANPGAVEALRALTIAYRDADYLSFDMTYYYAEEKSPKVYLDSMRGSFKMKGNRYWYSMANTESLRRDDFIVTVFNEDRIIYLSKPSPDMAGVNPVAMLDSFLSGSQFYSFDLQEDKKEKKLTIHFKDDLPYKKIEYVIDRKTGFISRMTSLVRSDQLADPSISLEPGTTKTYSIVEAVFEHYRLKSFDESAFDTTRYFRKEGKDYVALPPYDAYKIFLGSPNL